MEVGVSGSDLRGGEERERRGGWSWEEGGVGGEGWREEIVLELRGEKRTWVVGQRKRKRRTDGTVSMRMDRDR